ncbi:MAG: chemotaxis protein CheW [Nitrospiria bacterium]
MTLVIFSLKNERYAVDVKDVEEVIPLPAITPLANQPTFVCGMIYLRGRAVPVIDLRKRLEFGNPTLELDNDIIVTRVDTLVTGLIVDKVLSVVDIEEPQLIDPPNMIKGTQLKYISAVAQIDETHVILLDLQKMLAGGEAATLRSLEITTGKAGALRHEL